MPTPIANWLGTRRSNSWRCALDGNGDVECEPTGPNEAILFRPIELPAGGSVTIDMLVSGAFTGWSGDRGTFEHWLRPALNWFRSTDLDAVEHTSAKEWDDFIEPISRPLLSQADLCSSPEAIGRSRRHSTPTPRGRHRLWIRSRAVGLLLAARRDLGRWRPRAAWAYPAIGRGVYQWLNKVRQRHRPFLYWFQKYSLDGVPEWETPAVDQTAMIPWGLECHYRRTGDLDLVAAVWPMIEQAALVCEGESGAHPGLKMLDDLNLISSAGSGEQLFGAFLYSNACVVAGLRAAARLATQLGMTASATRWMARADRIWNDGICKSIATNRPEGPGLVDPDLGRFLQARRLSKLRGLWTDDPELLIDKSATPRHQYAEPRRSLRIAAGRRSALTAQNCRDNPPHQRGSSRATRTSCHAYSYEPLQSGRPRSLSSDQHDVSEVWRRSGWPGSWIQLGRETGQARHWTRALAMLEGDLQPAFLNSACRSSPRRAAGLESARQISNPGGTAWRLHAMLIDTILDLAGLDYDAVEHRLTLSPVLPGQWPQTGIKQSFPCGDISYRLERPIGGKVHHLSLKAQLKHPVKLQVELTCPDLAELGPWHAAPETAAPILEPRTNQLRWSVTLPSSTSEWNWTWGGAGRCNQGSLGLRRHGPSGGGSSTNCWYISLTAPRRSFRANPAARSRARKTTPFSNSCPKSP